MATFLDLTNRTLARLNEIQLTSATFPGVKGFHNLVKLSVNAAVQDIIIRKVQWPFLYTTTSQLLVVGTNLYSKPANMLMLDKDTFRLAENTSFGVLPSRLRIIPYDNWANYLRPKDLESTYPGSVPNVVFETPSGGWGISPKPDKAYTVWYEGWLTNAEMSAYSDVCIIPDSFIHVVVDGAVSYSYLFRENHTSYGLTYKVFDDGVKHMLRILMPEPTVMSDTRVRMV